MPVGLGFEQCVSNYRLQMPPDHRLRTLFYLSLHRCVQAVFSYTDLRCYVLLVA